MSKKKSGKTLKLLRTIVLILVGVLLIAIIIAIVVRNPVIESILEHKLTEKMGAEVRIDNFHVGLLKPSISIDRVTIQSKDDANVYLMETGHIKIRIRLWSLITKKLIDIPEMSFLDVNFLVPKDGVVRKNKEPSKLSQLLESVDIGSLLNDYLGDIHSLALVNDLSTQVSTAVTDGEAIIDKAATSFQQLNTSASALANDIRTVSNIAQAVRVLEKSTKTYNEANSIYKRSRAAYNTIETHAKQLARTANDIPNIIASDVKKIVDDVTNPKQFAVDISTQLVKQMLESPVQKYHNILSRLLTALDHMKETDTPDTAQSASSDKNSFSTKDLDKGIRTPIGYVSLRVETFHLSVGYQTISLFSLQAHNITNQIYSSPDPILFTVATGDSPVAVTGQGAFTMNKTLPYMLRAMVEYANVQSHIESPLSLIDIESVDTTLQGIVDMELTDTMNGTATIGINASDIQAVPRSNTDIGASVATLLEQISPIDVTADITFNGANISSFSLYGNFVSRLPKAIAPIVYAQLAPLKEQMTDEITTQLVEKTEQSLKAAQAQMDGVLAALGVKISSAKALVGLLSNNQDAISTKVSDMSQKAAQQVADKAAKKAAEKVKKAVENAVDSIKNSLPF